MSGTHQVKTLDQPHFKEREKHGLHLESDEQNVQIK